MAKADLTNRIKEGTLAERLKEQQRELTLNPAQRHIEDRIKDVEQAMHTAMEATKEEQERRDVYEKSVIKFFRETSDNLSVRDYRESIRRLQDIKTIVQEDKHASERLRSDITKMTTVFQQDISKRQNPIAKIARSFGHIPTNPTDLIKGGAGLFRDSGSIFAEALADTLKDTMHELNPLKILEEEVSPLFGHIREFGEKIRDIRKEREERKKDNVESRLGLVERLDALEKGKGEGVPAKADKVQVQADVVHVSPATSVDEDRFDDESPAYMGSEDTGTPVATPVVAESAMVDAERKKHKNIHLLNKIAAESVHETDEDKTIGEDWADRPLPLHTPIIPTPITAPVVAAPIAPKAPKTYSPEAEAFVAALDAKFDDGSGEAKVSDPPLLAAVQQQTQVLQAVASTLEGTRADEKQRAEDALDDREDAQLMADHYQRQTQAVVAAAQQQTRVAAKPVPVKESGETGKEFFENMLHTAGGYLLGEGLISMVPMAVTALGGLPAILGGVIAAIGAYGIYRLFDITKNAAQGKHDTSKNLNFQGSRDMLMMGHGTADFTDPGIKHHTASKQSAPYEKFIDEAAHETGVRPELIRSIIDAESGFNPQVMSGKGAIGLMQLMPQTAKDMNVSDPWDPEQNILGGARYLAKMLERYNGDIRKAVAAYNAGPGNVDKYNGPPPFPENQNYLHRVLPGVDANAQGPQMGIKPSAYIVPAAPARAALTESLITNQQQVDSQQSGAVATSGQTIVAPTNNIVNNQRTIIHQSIQARNEDRSLMFGTRNPFTDI